MGVTIQTLDALPTGYSVSITFDHQALVAQGRSRSDGEDIRIVHWNGSGWDAEQDRVLAVGSSWNTTNTSVYFKTSGALSASVFDRSYYVYFGNASPSASLHNPDIVYVLWDDFNDGTLDAAKWHLTGASPGVVVSETGGKLQIAGAPDAAHMETQIGVETNLVMPTEYLAESTIAGSLDSQVLSSSKIAVGTDDGEMVIQNKQWSYWQSHTGWVHVAPTNIVQQSISPTRVATSRTSSAVSAYENGSTVATRSVQHTYPHARYTYAPENTAYTNTVTFDDIVIRKYVNNEPITVLDGVSATTVSANVDPVLTFDVNGRATPGTCNGATMTSITSSSTIDFGSVVSGVRSGAHDLHVITNVANGYTVSIRKTQPLQSVSHAIPDAPGSATTPLTFPSTEAFGYSTDGASQFATDKWAGITNTNQATATQTSGPRDDIHCVAYQVRAGATTLAGNYNTTVIYTVVPTF